MPHQPHNLRAVYIDGETKTGKGAASKAIAHALHFAGKTVYYDVAGDFFRRYTVLVRVRAGLDEDDPLVITPEVEQIAREFFTSGEVFAARDDLGDLQRPAISQSVSLLGALPFVQEAGDAWYAASLRQAHEAGVDVLVLDGRNPRLRITEQQPSTGLPVTTALDLYMTCDPAEAARRTLLQRDITDPSADQMRAEEQHVIERRTKDRQRAANPFLVPTVCIDFDIEHGQSASDAVAAAWKALPAEARPATICVNNTHLGMSDMLSAVTELAVAAVDAAQ